VVASVATATAAHLGAANSAASRASRERELTLLLDTAKKLNLLGSPREVVNDIALAAATFVSQGPFGVKARATLFRFGTGIVSVVAEHDDLGISLKGRDYQIAPNFVELVEGGARSFDVDELPDSLVAAYRTAQVTSIAAAPVRVGGDLFGFLAAASRDERRAGARELNLLKGLADLGGLALAQADRLTFERAKARLYAALFDMSLATAEATAPEEVGRAVLKQARELADADVALVAFEDGGLLRPVAVHPRRGVSAAAFNAKRGVLGQAYQRRQTVVVNNRRAFTEPEDRSILPKGGSLAAIPLLAGRQTLGVLAVGAQRHSFHTEQLDALRVLASQLGPAMEAAAMRSGLAESEARFRSLYAGLACGVVIHDLWGNLVDANWAALQLLGVSRKAIERKGFLGPEWTVRLAGGSEVPLSNRPPGAVITFKKPIQNLVAEVTPPRGAPRWLRIDSREIQQREQAVWVVTSFFEVPAPGSRA
jgi:GAF domain-containing protein